MATYLSTTGKVRANRNPGGKYDVFFNGRKVGDMTKEPTGYVVMLPFMLPTPVSAKGLKDILDLVENACTNRS